MLNGNITYRSRKYPIYWTGQHAQHIAENYFENNKNLLHVEIQQALQKAEIKKDVSGGLLGLYEAASYTVYIRFFVRNNFAIIKTAHTVMATKDKISKNQNYTKVGKVKEPIPEYISLEEFKDLIVGGWEQVENVEFLWEVFNESCHKKILEDRKKAKKKAKK